MKIFVAGASGAIGKRLVPLQLADGHQVIATTRTPAKIGTLRATGAEALVMDGLGQDTVMKAVQMCKPDVIIEQMTALSSLNDFKHFDQSFALTNRLRTQGTEYLLRAAMAVGVRRFIAQSYTGWANNRSAGRATTEDDPWDANPPDSMKGTLQAIRTLEGMVLNAQGMTRIVLRYGGFYGPGTSLGESGEMTDMVRDRKVPIVGNGAGVWSFIHIDDAAQATRLAVDHGESGIYNIVDNEPAEVSAWLPFLAKSIDAKPPRHVPAWIARFAVGDAGVLMMTAIKGASNAKAKRQLGWQLQYPSWRDGFQRGMGEGAGSASLRRAS